MNHKNSNGNNNYSLILFSLLTLTFSNLLAQGGIIEELAPDTHGEIETIGEGSDSDTLWGGYGGPFIYATSFGNEWGVFIGGRGGFIVNRIFSMGGVGGGFAGSINKTYQTNSYDISMGYGGLYFEFTYQMKKPIHFSFPIDIVVGGTSLSDDNATDENSTPNGTVFYAVIPRASVEFNFAKFFILNVNAGYRIAFGSDSNYVDNGDLSGIEVGLLFKFGKF